MGQTIIKYDKVQHSINELKTLYNSRVTKDEYLQMNNVLKANRYSDIRNNDIKDYADSLQRLNRRIKLLYYLLEDAKNGFENSDRYKKIAAKVKKNKYGKTAKEIRKKLAKLGYSYYQREIILGMAGKTGAKKVKRDVKYLVYSSVIPKESYETLVKRDSEQKSTISDQDKEIEEKDKEIQNQKSQSEAKDKQIAAKDEAIKSKDAEINELKDEINQKNAEAQQQASNEQSSNDEYASNDTSSDTGSTESSGEESSNTEGNSYQSPATGTGESDTESGTDLTTEDEEAITIGEGDSGDDTSSPKRKTNVVPAILGVGAAGAAGFAGVRYIKNKNKDNYNTEEYDENDSDDVDYSYSDDSNGEDNYSEEKYSAGSKKEDHLSVDGDTIKVNDDSNNLSLDEDEEIRIEDDYQDDFDEELE
ncbi:MAG: hypothetical protein IJF92_05635 [Bacilli bacterium]|nr:hypothetical protein [Bacilli bacterium]